MLNIIVIYYRDFVLIFVTVNILTTLHLVKELFPLPVCKYPYLFVLQSSAEYISYFILASFVHLMKWSEM